MAFCWLVSRALLLERYKFHLAPWKTDVCGLRAPRRDALAPDLAALRAASLDLQTHTDTKVLLSNIIRLRFDLFQTPLTVAP